MKHAKKALVAGLLTAAASLGTSSTSRAVIYTEPGDAGQTLATATATGTNSTTALTAINGTIGTGTDADLYVLTITSTTTFSAVAIGGTSSVAGNGQIDTSLFLFNSAGVPLLANDDQSNASYQGALPAGNSLLTTLSAGTYYLGISLSGNEAVNSAGQLLFTTDQPTTNVRGIASGLNPTTESTFNGQTFAPETGSYTINLTGANTAAAVPEPSTWAVLALGATTLGLALRRRPSSLTA